MEKNLLNYQILMLDLDGTLLRKHNTIEKSTGEVLKHFSDNGGIVMFNTGRSLTSALKIREQLKTKFDVETSVISCFNGSIIYDCIEEKIIHEFKIDSQTIKTIVNIAKIKNIKLGIYDGISSAKTSLIIANGSKRLVNFINGFSKKLNYVEYDENINYNNVYKILAFLSLNKYKSNHLITYLDTAFDILNENNQIINYAKPTKFMYEITSTFSNKGNAIPYMLEIINKHGYNFKKEDICAIGDSDNDLPMFGQDAVNNPTVGLALALGMKLNETHKISNEANKRWKKPHLLAKFIKNFVFKYN